MAKGQYDKKQNAGYVAGAATGSVPDGTPPSATTVGTPPEQKKDARSTVNTWPALEVKQLKMLFGELCKARTRALTLQGRADYSSPTTFLENVEVRMCGRLLNAILGQYHNMTGLRTSKNHKNIPTHGDLAALAQVLHHPPMKISAKDFGSFLAGNVPSNKAFHIWCRHTYEWIGNILLGYDGALGEQNNATDEQMRIVDELRTFFLGRQLDAPSPYFDKLRITWDSPANEEEAYWGAVSAGYRQRSLGREGLMVLTSGDAPFAQEADSHIGQAYRYVDLALDLVKNGFHVYFVYPDPEQIATAASASAERLFEGILRRSRSKEVRERIHPVPLRSNAKAQANVSTTLPVPDAKEYLHRTLRFVYIADAIDQAPRDRDLYLIRTGLGDESKWIPYAQRCYDMELQAFKQWYEMYIPHNAITLREWRQNDRRRGSRSGG